MRAPFQRLIVAELEQPALDRVNLAVREQIGDGQHCQETNPVSQFAHGLLLLQEAGGSKRICAVALWALHVMLAA